MSKNITTDDFRSDNKYEIVAISGIGRRDTQQDAAYWYADDNYVYAVVCDGMGGFNGGELASADAVKTLRESVLSEHDTWETEGVNKQWMISAINRANKKVYSLTKENGERLGAGSTAVSVLIQHHHLYWASVGDSRLYIARAGEIVQATTDLNYQYMLENKRSFGKITEEQYTKDMERGDALISFLGLKELDIVDCNIEAFRLKRGDVIILCSDGLYRTIDEKWLGDILDMCEHFEDISKFIDMIINEHGNQYQDNYTALFIRINE